jgi:hypothetical protein
MVYLHLLREYRWPWHVLKSELNVQLFALKSSLLLDIYAAFLHMYTNRLWYIYSEYATKNVLNVPSAGYLGYDAQDVYITSVLDVL